MDERDFLTHRRVVIIGPVDSGKSYLFKRIVELWRKRGYRFSALDLDVGQSTLGLPTTMNCLCGKIHHFFFYGFTSPRVYPLRFLAGVSRLNRGGRLVVDTTGYVEVPHGFELKVNILEIIKPDLVVAFSLGENPWREFLDAFPGDVMHLERAPGVRKRSAVQRENYREGKFRDYFADTEQTVVPLNKLLPIRPGHRPSPGNLVSFRKRGEDLFLGWIEKIEGDRAMINYPSGKIPTGEMVFSYYNIKRAKQPNLFEGVKDEGMD